MYIIGDNIISALGFTTGENYFAAKQGVSGIKCYDVSTFGLSEPFMASLVNKERLNDEFAKLSSENKYTQLEKAAILSVFFANKETHIDLSNNRTLFILSTTKGNIDLLDGIRVKNFSPLQIYLWHIAELIAGFFGNPNAPVVVSNACISGAAAQIVAHRALASEKYDYAVVVGVDFLSKFIISGFQSFKALSPELCRPFDKNRCGLNLGEAAATMIMGKEKGERRKEKNNTLSPYFQKAPLVAEEINTLNPDFQEAPLVAFRYISGAVRNDATHISAPSRTGEGSFRALNAILNSPFSFLPSPSTPFTPHPSPLTPHLAFINAHGTATSYNDAMEMNAIARAGLADVPVNALKSYFGHTLGAAGVVETIISMQALNEGMVLKTLGFEEIEPVTMNNEQFTLEVCKENRATDKNCFIKLMSGFGGVNAALIYEKFV